MGIPDLWLALSPACQTRTLTEITVREGFEAIRRPGRCIHVAIDSSIWMNQAQTAINFKRGPGTQIGENAALRILFYRLCRLLTLPIIPIFVFDGPERPSVKRQVQVRSGKSHGLTAGFTAFIEAFGFYWFKAPGEADADLAELSKRHLVDAVMSEDVDVLVFGALSVIRMGNTRTAGDLVDIFDSQKIQTNPRVLLTHEGLFFMAILCGGDYDKTGLSGCGWKTALLLSQTSLAKSLFVAASTLSSRADLQDFLKGWRNEFRDYLINDPDGHLGKRYPALARQVNHDFPLVNVLFLYARPLTSWTADAVPDSSSWILSEPDLPKIASLCEKYFSWGSSDGSLATRFKDHVWPGIALRFFLSLPSIHDQLVSYSKNESSPGGFFTNANVLCIRQEKVGPGGPATHSNVIGYTIEISTTTLLCATAFYLEPTTGSTIIQSNISKTLIWIPASVLAIVLPTMVQAFRVHKKLSDPGPTFYQPVLPPLPNLSALLLLEPGSPSALAGPSNYRAKSPSHGDSVSNPIILSDSDVAPGASSSSTKSREILSLSAHHKNGRVFLGHIDLC